MDIVENIKMHWSNEFSDIYFKHYDEYFYCRLRGINKNGYKDIILTTANQAICIPDGYLHLI